LSERDDNDTAQRRSDDRAGILGDRGHTECTWKVLQWNNVRDHCLPCWTIECYLRLPGWLSADKIYQMVMYPVKGQELPGPMPSMVMAVWVTNRDSARFSVSATGPTHKEKTMIGRMRASRFRPAPGAAAACQDADMPEDGGNLHLRAGNGDQQSQPQVKIALMTQCWRNG